MELRRVFLNKVRGKGEFVKISCSKFRIKSSLRMLFSKPYVLKSEKEVDMLDKSSPKT